jgi:hypothetical protein
MPSSATLRWAPFKEHRNRTRNVKNIERPFKVFAVSLVLTPTLHQADDPLLFWRERIAKLAKG